MSIRAQFDQQLKTCVRLGASDVHLTSNQPVSYRVHSRMEVHGPEVIDAQTMTKLCESIMNERQREEFAARWTVDLGHTASCGERFRINVYKEMGQPAMAVRHLNQDILSFDELGLPVALKDLAQLRSGLVLVSGVTGSGKSTTLAVLLDEINKHREGHILTVEDPVEFVHRNKRCLVHHREVHTDVVSFADAVRAGLREDPDVIMVGEMRDVETMRAAMIAAETGHLVFSTLHTGHAVGAVERFIGGFSAEEQDLARHRLSLVLKAVVAQQLVLEKHGEGRVPAIEMLQNTHAVGNLIRSGKSQQIQALLEAGSQQNMWTLDQDLVRLVKAGRISEASARLHCSSVEGLESLMKHSHQQKGTTWR